MVRYLLILFLMFTTVALADDTWSEDHLQSVYGKDLTQAPYYLRFAFQKRFNVDWSKSYYVDRKQFLMDYQSSVDKDAKKAQIEAKQEAQEEKDELRQQKEAEHEKRMKLKAEHDKEVAELRAERESQREFNAKIKQQQEEINQLNQQAKAQSVQSTGASQ